MTDTATAVDLDGNTYELAAYRDPLSDEQERGEDRELAAYAHPGEGATYATDDSDDAATVAWTPPTGEPTEPAPGAAKASAGNTDPVGKK